MPSKSELAQLEADDLDELLAATNAKRRARGKQELSVEDVNAQVEADSASRRPRGASRWDLI